MAICSRSSFGASDSSCAPTCALKSRPISMSVFVFVHRSVCFLKLGIHVFYVLVSVSVLFRVQEINLFVFSKRGWVLSSHLNHLSAVQYNLHIHCPVYNTTSSVHSDQSVHVNPTGNKYHNYPARTCQRSWRRAICQGEGFDQRDGGWKTGRVRMLPSRPNVAKCAFFLNGHENCTICSTQERGCGVADIPRPARCLLCCGDKASCRGGGKRWVGGEPMITAGPTLRGAARSRTHQEGRGDTRPN